MNILDLLFPKRCVECGKVGQYFCGTCRTRMKPILQSETICPVCEKPAMDGMTHHRCHTKYTIDGLTSFFHYAGPVRNAVKSIKYRFVSDVTKEFVDCIPSMFLSSLIRNSQFGNSPCLLPIPLHPTRLRFRGFNQAEVLGSLVADRLQMPIKTDVLKRLKKTTPQVEMKEKEKRLKNMENVFSALLSMMNYERSTIFLFDDVFTTGATMRSAASVLKKAGAKFVWGITMAR